MIANEQVKESIEHLFKNRNPHVKVFKDFIEENLKQELEYLTLCPDESASDQKMRFKAGRASVLKDIIKLLG